MKTKHELELADVKAIAAAAEAEALKNNWSARELERQINSLLFERLAKSKDKAGLMQLATKGQEVATPSDVFKDPVVIEFLGLPESHRLAESDLEQALIDWTKDHWPMAARAMVYNKAEADNMVSGVNGVRSDEGQLVMSVAARVAISERELLIRGLAAILPQWLEQTYGLTPKR